nr:DAK2 domain-containing protein [Lactobacillus sp. S2-2]
MVQAGSINLKNNADFINSLNVFPVPDGDTGTNMNLSFSSGYDYVVKDNSTSISEKANALAKGLLMGARGNSGVILSQIFRGFANSLDGISEADANDYANAVLVAAKTAYSSVMKPTEGTILTVIRCAAKKGQDIVKETNDVAKLADEIAEEADKALKTTPDLLPVLKEVNVVDSGGQGLVFVLKSFADILNDREVNNDVVENNDENESMSTMVDEEHESVQGKINPEDIVYGYCTQVMIRIGKGKQVTRKFDYQQFYDYLSNLGDSLLVINDDEIAKVHVHTEQPGKVISWAQTFGDLANVKIDNMRLQQEEIMAKDQPNDNGKPETEVESPDTAIISVSSGEGIQKLFKSLGVTNTINGGQTMNPSTQDIVDVVNNSNAKKAIILPNNKNIFLAAEQASKLTDIPLLVVHSKNISQGLSAMFSYNPDESIEENVSMMEDSLDYVSNGQITVAVRDTKFNNLDIKKGNYMGIIDGEITVLDDNLVEASIKMIKKMIDDDSENVTIIYGSDSSMDEAQKISDAISEIDDEIEVEVHEGNQPVYPLIVSVE